MPKYGTQVEYAPRQNEDYEIVSVDEITTRNNNLGVKVELKSTNENDKRVYSQTLWPQSETMNTSPWGAFLSVLGNDTDAWIARKVKILSIAMRAYEIVLIDEKIKKGGK